MASGGRQPTESERSWNEVGTESQRLKNRLLAGPRVPVLGADEISTRMTLIPRIFADRIREDLPDARYPRGIVLVIDLVFKALTMTTAKERARRRCRR